ncbi:MAG TPA: DUF433 domain-containing protein [Frankiaceae bacterium]|nr:DUF433 domain-containing protein [Frankiaceae bacterium]
MTQPPDERFSVPLYTLREAATHLGVPGQTFSRWARGYTAPRPSGKPTVSPPVVTSLRGEPGRPVVPFVGLAEGMVLAAIRRAGVPLQRIRPALAALERELGVAHALASERLYTDGAELLYDYAGTTSDEDVREGLQNLVVARSGQRVFAEVVAAYLRRISYADDGWAMRVELPAYHVATVLADPRVNFGQPYFAIGGVRVEDVLDRWHAGESWDELAGDYGIPAREIEDAVRVSKQRAAA